MGANQRFSPGFRISMIDVAVIVAGVAGTGALWPVIGSLGLLIAFVTGHFFLFCNVFRIARKLELAWAGLFVGLACATIIFRNPSWTVTIVATSVVSILVVCVELRKPSYHGIGWQIINPNLRAWWDVNEGNGIGRQAQ